jgi:hypothetical protein
VSFDVIDVIKTDQLKRVVKEMTSAVIAGAMLISMMMFSASASAECACFCVNGDLQTLCTTVDEAQDEPTLCSAYSQKLCPSEPGESASASYNAPAEGATNCRDIRVFDALSGVFKTVKACDVLSSS